MPSAIALPATRNRGPYRSTANPKAGEMAARTRSRTSSAPVITVRLQPSSAVIGLKKNPKVCAPNPTRIPWLRKPQATMYQPWNTTGRREPIPIAAPLRRAL